MFENAEQCVFNIRDIVFINDSRVYLSATPHTITQSQYVYFNLTSKVFTGDADLVWGFDREEAKPTKPELYHPHNVSWNTSHDYFFYNVSSITTTTAQCELGNEYNSIKRNVTFSDEIYSNETFQLIVCFDSYEQNGTNYTIQWHIRHRKERNWINFPLDLLRYGSLSFLCFYFLILILFIGNLKYPEDGWIIEKI